jgi:hypothetical protein
MAAVPQTAAEWVALHDVVHPGPFVFTQSQLPAVITSLKAIYGQLPYDDTLIWMGLPIVFEPEPTLFGVICEALHIPQLAAWLGRRRLVRWFG